jgi:hypothetical protein
MRQKLTTALEVSGAALITAGAGWMFRPAALLVAGCFAIVGGFLLAGDR